MSKKVDEKEKTVDKESEAVDVQKEPSSEPTAKAEPIKIMGEPKTEPRSENQPDIGKIVSDVFDQKLAKFLDKGPISEPPKPEPAKYKLFDEFDIGV